MRPAPDSAPRVVDDLTDELGVVDTRRRDLDGKIVGRVHREVEVLHHRPYRVGVLVDNPHPLDVAPTASTTNHLPLADEIARACRGRAAPLEDATELHLVRARVVPVEIVAAAGAARTPVEATGERYTLTTAPRGREHLHLVGSGDQRKRQKSERKEQLQSAHDKSPCGSDRRLARRCLGRRGNDSDEIKKVLTGQPGRHDEGIAKGLDDPCIARQGRAVFVERGGDDNILPVDGDELGTIVGKVLRVVLKDAPPDGDVSGVLVGKLDLIRATRRVDDAIARNGSSVHVVFQEHVLLGKIDPEVELARLFPRHVERTFRATDTLVGDIAVRHRVGIVRREEESTDVADETGPALFFRNELRANDLCLLVFVLVLEAENRCLGNEDGGAREGDKNPNRDDECLAR